MKFVYDRRNNRVLLDSNHKGGSSIKATGAINDGDIEEGVVDAFENDRR